ncbi:hypothetical protein H0N98_01460 [Candidatus Micrarchaeota archaeon]|nr:hypothetical protein [Candidatus Micrarchaeota archaeon]
MFKMRKEEQPVLDGENLKKVYKHENCFEYKAGELKVFVAKHMVIVKGKTNLDNVGIKKAEWTMKCKPADAETFEMDMSVSKASLRGRFPHLIISKSVSVHGKNFFVSAKIDKTDMGKLASRIEVDGNGFLNLSHIKKAADSAAAGEIKIEDDSKEQLTHILIFEKAIMRAGRVFNEAVTLPNNPVIAEDLKNLELQRRRLG